MLPTLLATAAEMPEAEPVLSVPVLIAIGAFFCLAFPAIAAALLRMQRGY